jgi:dual specificity phosphatase 12
MVEIIPGLWLGDLRTALDVEFLANNRIGCVINCTDSCPFADYSALSIRIPLRDNGKESEMQRMYEIMDRVVTMIYKLLPQHRVLVHCYAGRQRSVAVILGFIMKYAQYNLQESIDVLRSKKPDIGINFSPALSQYYMDLACRKINESTPR